MKKDSRKRKFKSLQMILGNWVYNWIWIPVIIILLVSCNPQNEEMKFIGDLIDKMTLDEKIGQMNQYTGFFDPTGPEPNGSKEKMKYDHIKSGMVGSMLNVRGANQVREMQRLAVENSRLGIPMLFGFDVIHGHQTIMPIPLAEAASWDLEIIERSARIGALESSAQGINWTFAPMVDVSRDARWGRVMEGAGEDPYLGSKIAAARVVGFQGNDPGDPGTIAACAKHFAAYGFAESGKDYNSADIGLSTLFNVVLPPFRSSLDAGVMTFMNSFNELNGIPATGDFWLQRDLLKGEWGFEGFVISDWGSILEMVNHGFAEDGKHAARIASLAGCDMDMESHLYIAHLKSMVESGEVDVEVINDAVRRILLVKQKLGLFEDPYRYCDETREKELVGCDDHLEAALDIATKSIVLLKNEENLLPVEKKGKNIAVIGHLASSKNSPLGNWRLAAQDHSAISILEGLKSYTGNNYTYEQGVKLFDKTEHFVLELEINESDTSGLENAVQLASQSDIVFMVLGEHGYQTGEGRSRAKLGLPGLQQEMLEAVYAVNPNIVLILMNGRPLVIPWAVDHIPAILETWQLGTQSGHAIARVLFGDYNPSGKLPMTFPSDIGQVPIYYNYKNTGRPGPKTEVFWSHYTDHSNEPLFPFGFGLSYTDFKYSNIIVRTKEVDKVEVSINVENIGEYDGEEVIQLYTRDKVASITRPIKELKGFKKVLLKKGEKIKVNFELGPEELGFYNNKGAWVVEPGLFEVFISGLSTSFNYKNNKAIVSP